MKYLCPICAHFMYVHIDGVSNGCSPIRKYDCLANPNIVLNLYAGNIEENTSISYPKVSKCNKYKEIHAYGGF